MIRPMDRLPLAILLCLLATVACGAKDLAPSTLLSSITYGLYTLPQDRAFCIDSEQNSVLYDGRANYFLTDTLLGRSNLPFTGTTTEIPLSIGYYRRTGIRPWAVNCSYEHHEWRPQAASNTREYLLPHSDSVTEGTETLVCNWYEQKSETWYRAFNSSDTSVDLLFSLPEGPIRIGTYFRLSLESGLPADPDQFAEDNRDIYQTFFVNTSSPDEQPEIVVHNAFIESLRRHTYSVDILGLIPFYLETDVINHYAEAAVRWKRFSDLKTTERLFVPGCIIEPETHTTEYTSDETRQNFFETALTYAAILPARAGKWRFGLGGAIVGRLPPVEYESDILQGYSVVPQDGELSIFAIHREVGEQYYLARGTLDYNVGLSARRSVYLKPFRGFNIALRPDVCFAHDYECTENYLTDTWIEKDKVDENGDADVDDAVDKHYLIEKRYTINGAEAEIHDRGAFTFPVGVIVAPGDLFFERVFPIEFLFGLKMVFALERIEQRHAAVGYDQIDAVFDGRGNELSRSEAVFHREKEAREPEIRWSTNASYEYQIGMSALLPGDIRVDVHLNAGNCSSIDDLRFQATVPLN